MIVRWSMGGICNLNVVVITSASVFLGIDEAFSFRLARNIVRTLGRLKQGSSHGNNSEEVMDHSDNVKSGFFPR